MSYIYPELTWSAVPREWPTPAQQARLLPIIIQMFQFLEDTYTRCEFERFWNHPLNVGWSNYFGRWATTPLIRDWWAILSPMYNSRCVRFAQQHLGLPGPISGEIEPPRNADGMATVMWIQMFGAVPTGCHRYSWVVRLCGQDVEAAVAFVKVTNANQSRHAEWTAKNFFVPPSLWGAGIGSRFLDKLVNTLVEREKVSYCRVKIEEPQSPDEASRKEHADLVQMYREHEFKTREFRSDRSGQRFTILQRTLAGRGTMTQ